MKERILNLAYENKLSHIGSALSAVDIIDEIYKLKKSDEPFILSCGHAFLAQQVVMEKYGIPIKEFSTHPESWQEGVDLPTGSLGLGLATAVGMALADRSKNVWCLISDGECAEGIVWEALRVASEQKLDNLKVYCNANGFGAYGEIDRDLLEQRLKLFFPVDFRRTSVAPLEGLKAHYQVLSEEEYGKITNK